MGLVERLGEAAVADGHSAHVDLICGGCSLWGGCLFCHGASRFRHDPAVIARDSVCARIPLAVFPDVCHSLPNRSLDITNTCVPKRIVPN